MDERLDFLFLNEAEAVKAGAGDMERCIEAVSYTHLTLPTNREV